MKERFSPNKFRLTSLTLVLILVISIANSALCQTLPNTNAQKESIAIDTLNKNRLKTTLFVGGTTYALGSTGLYLAWYKDYPRSGFHFFDDYGQWSHMDKVGHIYSTYAQSELLYKGFRWTGLSENQSILYGLGTSLLFQSTIEVMDGFSTEWGFSWTDFGANVIGATAFGLQQKTWGEQRLRIKFSASPVDYSRDINQSISLVDRSEHLFGTNTIEKLLKDYNGQTYWLSLNPRSFTKKDTWIPDWMNIAFGYGAANMLGGYDNIWTQEGELFNANNEYQRYQQFYLSLDADLSKIKTSSKVWRTLLDILNYIKLPFSTIEINTLGQVKFHILHF